MNISSLLLCSHRHLQVLFLHLTFYISLLTFPVLQEYMVQGERYRVQCLFALRWFQLALPYRDAMPPHLCQLPLLLLVPLLVPLNLCHPELPVRLRNLTALRTLNVYCFLFIGYCNIVSMPEAPIHKDARPVFPQHQVRMSWQPLMVQPVSESPLPQATSHNDLRLRILRVDSRHI